MKGITMALGLAGLAGAAAGQGIGVLPAWTLLADGGGSIPTLQFDNNSQRFGMHAWHRDGADKPAVLAVVGWVQRDGVRGSMATWDGSRWDLYPEIPGGSNMGRSTLFDPDGEGPEPERLYAIRMGAAPSRVVSWNGTSWVSVGTLTEPLVSSWGDLASFDPDGAGPARPWLIHANQRASALIDGQWNDLGLVQSPFPNRVASLQQFDPDGDGPEAPVLVIAGAFTSVGGSPASNVAVLRGIDWAPMPGITSAGVAGRMAVHDFDGAGPGVAELVVPMRSTVGGVQTDLAAWNGVSWRAVVAGTSDVSPTIPYPQNAASVTAPGVLEGLVAFGQFAAHAGSPVAAVGVVDPVAGAVRPLSAAAGAGFTSYVDSVVAVDLDGEGPQPAAVFAIGPAQRSNGIAIPGVARWNGGQWQPMTGAFTTPGSVPTVTGISAIDPDGDGPSEETSYIQGYFTRYGGVDGTGATGGYGGVAAFDGAVSPMAGGHNPVLTNPGTVLAFDPDGDGPEGARTLASGYRLEEWDGSGWSTLWGQAQTFRMTLHDFDGNGPAAPRVVFGAPVANGGVLEYDGHVVAPVGPTEHLGTAGMVRVVLSHDVDGPGPAVPLLYAGGVGLLSAVMVYDGEWHIVGERFGGTVRALAMLDPDGPGPRGEEIFAGGTMGVRSWDGVVWRTLPELPAAGSVEDLTTFDPDGDGPVAPRLIVACRDADGSHLRRWNEGSGAWDPLDGVASDFTSRVMTIGVERPFGPRGPQRLAFGIQDPGAPDGTGASAAVARYTSLGKAWLTEEPGDAAAEEGGMVTLTATVQRAYAQAGATYQWRRDGDPVPGAAGVFSAGCGTATLTIAAASPGDAGVYELAVTNAAGESFSRPATVSVMRACRPDFNRDGFLDFFDYDDFVGCFETGQCPSGTTADFNGDGFADFFDYDDFVAAFEAGC